MQKKHFTVVGKLGWQLALDNVVLDNLLTGQASAESWRRQLGRLLRRGKYCLKLANK